MKKRNTVTKNWFKDWANEYDSTLGKVKRHHKLLDLVVKSSNVKSKDKVLDIGCGTGLLSLKFLQKADCLIYGIDNSPEMLKIFKNKIDKLDLSEKIVCKLACAENIDFEINYFDIIASTVTLHHVKSKYPVIKKIYKLLKPDGKFVLGDIDMQPSSRITAVENSSFPGDGTFFKDFMCFFHVVAVSQGQVITFVYDFSCCKE